MLEGESVHFLPYSLVALYMGKMHLSKVGEMQASVDSVGGDGQDTP